MSELLRCELAERLLNDVALFETVPDADKGELLQRGDIVLNKASHKLSLRERGMETLSASRYIDFGDGRGIESSETEEISAALDLRFSSEP